MKYLTRMTVLVFLLATVFALGLISGCGATLEEKQAYRNSKTLKPIEMPPGLAMPRNEESLEIPEQTETKIATVDELEQPPQIIESADLKILDDNNAKASSSSNSSSENSANSENTKTASAPNLLAPLQIEVGKNENGDSLLLVDAEFDQVWLRVKPAVMELGFTIDDASKGNEVYVISRALPEVSAFDRPVHPGDEKPEVREEFQIHVKPSDGKIRITVHNKFGQLEGSGLAEHLLLQIKQLMENPKPIPKEPEPASEG